MPWPNTDGFPTWVAIVSSWCIGLKSPDRAGVPDEHRARQRRELLGALLADRNGVERGGGSRTLLLLGNLTAASERSGAGPGPGRASGHET